MGEQEEVVMEYDPGLTPRLMAFLQKAISSPRGMGYINKKRLIEIGRRAENDGHIIRKTGELIQKESV
jgi:hypothetical protein